MSRILSRRKFLTLTGAVAAGAALGRVARAEVPVYPKALAAGNARFGCELFGKLRTEEGNLFLSPFSISTALAMTAAGARGKTLDEMAKVLHLPENPHAAFGAVIKSLNEAPHAGQKRGFELSTANALWAQAGYPWRAEYKGLVTENYAAGLNDVNFKADPEAARETINKWVEKETREKIKDLMPRDSVTAATRLVLTNAIYFKGDWATPFKKDLTKDLPFHLTGGKTVDAPLMYRVGDFRYAEGEGYQTIHLPYTGHRIGMTVILPRKVDGLAAMEKELTAERVADDWKKMRPEENVRLFLPKFKMTKMFNLNAPLIDLGMRSAFGGADFGGMSTGGERFEISDVIHKAFVDVNEEGTEAAGATGVAVKATSFRPPPKEPVVFRADRPFLCLIRDAKTDSVLFLGRVANPKA
ncbi:MAG TPA: serpin family protein [Gemmataceae bacterium]|nr:serpin family protein [Gemmataceae bacterium]